MLSKRSVVVATLLLLLVAVSYGLVRTSGDDARPVATVAATSGDTLLAVDQSSLLMAQRLVRLPTTPEERSFADEALRIGDKEMDLAFANAVRRLATRPPRVTPEVEATTARLRRAEAELAADQQQVSQLMADSATALPGDRGTIADRLNIARAHQQLVRDELDDASQDLIRSGGDPKGRMQAMMAEHDALSASSDSTRINVVEPAESHGLIRYAQAWLGLHRKQGQLGEAKDAAVAAAIAFEKRHGEVEARRKARRDSAAAAKPIDHATATAMLLEVERQALIQKTRGTLDQHVDNQHRLVDLYGRWSALVAAQQRHQVNRALRGVAVILGIVLVAILLDRWLAILLARMSLDQRRTQTICMVGRVTLQVIGFVLILLVTFGKPDNLGTFLGLAGAGLTVALKDFLLSFFGWFVLMGRDGIGIGDQVEINGVTGEVVELGMFHTVLLETGNWVDSGHHTGRRVTFSNSFAVEKHYFNFSTNGRWMWDEVRFVVPSGRDTTLIVDALQQRVAALTADGARRVEAEMKATRRAARMNPFTAEPTIYIKPIVGGVEVTVRYLTHVHERAQLRAQLYQTAIALLSEKAGVVGGSLPALAASVGAHG
jgi:small-conductance mechanosensitive channel